MSRSATPQDDSPLPYDDHSSCCSYPSPSPPPIQEQHHQQQEQRKQKHKLHQQDQQQLQEQRQQKHKLHQQDTQQLQQAEQKITSSTTAATTASTPTPTPSPPPAASASTTLPGLQDDEEEAPSSPSSSSPASSSSNSASPGEPQPPHLAAQYQRVIRQAVRSGDSSGLRRLLEAREGKINLNVFDSEGQTVLHETCQLGNLELVKLLVRFGADVRLANRDGWSAVHIAAFGGHTDVLLYLMQAVNLACRRS